MPSNYGPTAFQSNAFQTHPLAFQIDHAQDEAPETGGYSAQTPQANGGFIVGSPKASAWVKGAAPANNYVSAPAPASNWTSTDEPNPTP